MKEITGVQSFMERPQAQRPYLAISAVKLTSWKAANWLMALVTFRSSESRIHTAGTGSSYRAFTSEILKMQTKMVQSAIFTRATECLRLTNSPELHQAYIVRLRALPRQDG